MLNAFGLMTSRERMAYPSRHNATNDRFGETASTMQFLACPPHDGQERLSLRIYKGDVRHVHNENPLLSRRDTLPVMVQFLRPTVPSVCPQASTWFAAPSPTS